MKLNKRTFSFLHTDISLTSRRVSIILNNKVDSSALADSVRANRHNPTKKITFSVSDETKEILKNELVCS
jgi:hypothetical protein